MIKRLFSTIIITGILFMTGCKTGDHDVPDGEHGQVLYDCSICKLHFEDQKTAKECEEWCRNNDSCNLAIAGKSIEARRKN